MGASNFFYLLSNALTLGVVLFLVSAILFRITHKTLGGARPKHGSSEYQWFEKISSGKAITIILTILFLSIVNLVPQIVRMFNEGQGSLDQFAIAVPVVVAGGYVGTVLYLRSIVQNKSDKPISKSDRDDEW